MGGIGQNILREDSEYSHVPSTLKEIIDELKLKWVPKTKPQVGYGYHGSNKGDEIEFTLYFDEYRCEWTTKDIAFKGYVFSYINKFIENFE